MPIATGSGGFAPRRQAMVHLALFARRRAMLPIGLVDAISAAGRQHSAVGAVVPRAVDRPLVPRRLRPGTADAALVHAERWRRSLSALCRLQPRQLLRADRLSAARRAAVPARHAKPGCGASATAASRCSSPGARSACRTRRRSHRAKPRPRRRAPDRSHLDPARGDPVRADALDHPAHHHRHHGDAAVVGASARRSICSASRSPLRHRRLAARSSVSSPLILLLACFGVFIDRRYRLPFSVRGAAS